MAWMKINENIGTHPKHLAVDPAASWLWLCAIGYSRDQLTDGFIAESALSVLGHFKKPDRLAARLVSAGLWRRDEEQHGWHIHDYHVMNPTKSDVLANRAQDSERKRRGIRSESRRNPPGIQAESARNPDGIRSESGGYSRASLSLSSDLSGSSGRERERGGGGRLVRAAPKNAVFAGVFVVPDFLDAEFERKSGWTYDQRQAWYAELNTAWTGRQIGESDLTFLRRRFEERIGSTAPASKVSAILAANERALAEVLAKMGKGGAS